MNWGGGGGHDYEIQGGGNKGTTMLRFSLLIHLGFFSYSL